MSDPNIANMLDMTPRGVCPVCGEEWGDGWQTHKADCTAIGPHKIAPAPRDRELEILRAQVRVLCSELARDLDPCGLDWECGATSFDDCNESLVDCWVRWSRRQAEKEVGGEG